ncbi:MAG: efflux transporter periplasmic adaptor subunit, partial [Rhizobacter sp.]|nr:efflux transporter periplasmic adaptor subunit [Rhizobacter sp.]
AALLPDRRGELQGRLQFVDNTVDIASGTVKVKAEFPNPKQQLWPGAYVNVRVNLETLKDAIVVPQASIIRGPVNESVYVVGPDRKAVQKVVQVVYSSANDAIVKGVEAGDKVVVDGRQNLRPGVAVFEKPAAAAIPAAPASGASESPAELASAASGGTSSANSRIVTTASTTAP